jgi:hypothetical protein
VTNAAVVALSASAAITVRIALRDTSALEKLLRVI